MTIISHTDAKGNISLCNDDFVEASGYTRKELIGQPHNILRHPDMPAEAFRDMWDTIQRGRPWSGIVKNRRKDGSYYWVRASATPLPDRSGFTSIRVRPKSDEVRTAEALYKRMQNGEKIHLHEGRVSDASSFNPLNKLNIAQRLWVMAILPTVMVALLVTYSLIALKNSNDGMQDIYAGSLIPTGQIADINDKNQMALIDLILAEEALSKKENPSDHLAEIKKDKAALEKSWLDYLATITDADEKKLADDHLAKRNAMWSLIERAAGDIATGNLDQATIIIHSQLDAVRWPQEKSIDKLTTYQETQAKTQYEKSAADYKQQFMLSIICGGLGALLTFVIAFVSMTYIRNTLRKTGEIALDIAKGDLTQLIPPANADEIGDLLAVIAIMRNSQHELIAAMRQNSESLTRCAGELSSSASNSATASVAQSEAVSSMAAAVEQLSASIGTVEENAGEANGASKRSVSVSGEGGRIIHEAADEMGQIADAVNATAGSIKQLEEMSLQITSIVNTIKEIADQTNLLALNAAIEAARAGEQGRGFAVVADEVRNLAARTTASTQDIATMVSKIQEGTRRAVNDMEAAVIQAKDGVEHAHKAGDTVVSIRAEAEQVASSVNEITHALKEQAAATRDISQKIDSVASGAETNSASATQTAKSAEHMAELAHQLNALTAYFKV